MGTGPSPADAGRPIRVAVLADDLVAAGRLDGNILLGGTVGQPTFNGDFQVRDGEIVETRGADGLSVDSLLAIVARPDQFTE